MNRPFKVGDRVACVVPCKCAPATDKCVVAGRVYVVKETNPSGQVQFFAPGGFWSPDRFRAAFACEETVTAYYEAITQDHTA